MRYLHGYMEQAIQLLLAGHCSVFRMGKTLGEIYVTHEDFYGIIGGKIVGRRTLMRSAIIEALQVIEEQQQVRILYACEAGSRAWGIQSEDSDYDVRFIYMQPRDVYLGLDVPRDVIELPIESNLDINGWDIYKALRLLRKSNPALLEWLFSPVIYLEQSRAAPEMRRIARSLIAPKTGLYYHYGHMAFGQYRQYIKEKSRVSLKKYLYVVRPLIMLLYLEQYAGEMPPTVSFPATLATVDLPEEIRTHIRDLIVRKQAGDELNLGAPDSVLNAFIDECLERWKAQTFGDQHDHQAMQRETANVLQSIFNERRLTEEISE